MQHGTERRSADKGFKDSIAVADGDKILGNIRFVTIPEEFLDEGYIFYQERPAYGIFLQNIMGKHNDQGKLLTVNSISCYCAADLHNNPFREFARDKFINPLPRNNDV